MFFSPISVAIELIVQHIRDFLYDRTLPDVSTIANNTSGSNLAVSGKLLNNNELGRLRPH